ncbi:MAG: HAD family hydrolase [Anaerolineales bacterium]|nr:HAD family hydrolase [Anaerolineales bacterium]
MNNLSYQPAIFLDRDGVIIENCPDYVRSWEQVEIYPQAVRALQRLAQLPYPLVIITNQSAVGRGLISRETADQINARLLEALHAAGARLAAVYLCPHAPQDHCNCRKPQPGLLLQAAADLQLDLPNSWLVGDALTDLGAGRAAGVGRLALLRTGRGAAQLALPAAQGYQPFEVYADLWGFVKAEFDTNPSC